jgi:hypothetical protein
MGRVAYLRVRRIAVWLSLLATGAACIVLESPAHGSPQPIGVIAPAGSRLAGELKRELSEANLTSVSMVTSDRDWPSEMIDLVSIPYLHGVVVGSNDGRIIVFSRGVTSGRVEVRLELSFDPNDRPARRRACLAAVEGLRALNETQPPPARVLASSAVPPLASAPPPPASAAEPPRSGAAPGPVALASPPASVTTHAASPVSAPAPPSLAAPAPREPWVMGVGTMLDLDHTLGAPMGHLAFLWFIPVRARLAVRTQVMWPVMGTALGPNATGIRIWTFGAAIGMQYAFAPAQARLRPFVGLAGGSQLLLTDTSGVSPEVEKPRAPFVPSANLRAHSGVRVTIWPRVQLLAEIEATRDWLLQSSRDLDYRNSIANTLAFHASLGALFEH